MHKNRGMFLESIINNTISFYAEHNICLIHKKEIPIKFSGITIKGNQRQLKKAWIKSKSTTDYYGLYKGMFMAFEAKSTKLTSLPLSNIKSHQINYLKKIHSLGGKAFFIMYFEKYNMFFMIEYKYFKKCIKNKSLPYDYVKKHGTTIPLIYPGIIDFINLI